MFRLLTGNLRRTLPPHRHYRLPGTPSQSCGSQCVEDEEPNLNTGIPRGEIDTRDLIWGVNDGQSVEEIADFLCRTKAEIRARMEELGLKEAENPKPFLPTSH